MCNSFEFRRRPTRRFLYYLFYFISVSMSESVTPWSHTLLLLFFFSFLFLFLWRDHVVCRLAYLDYVSEKMRLRFPIHIVCLFIFFVWDFPRTNGANLPMLFSGHKNFNTHKHFAQNQPTSSTLIRIHRQKSHQKLFAFRHFWNIETERERGSFLMHAVCSK